MAIDEHDREDLLGEARKMPNRGEALVGKAMVVVGFRQGMQLSLYCGSDPVFQFNNLGQLRRAYVSGDRFAAASGKLVRLSRQGKGGRVQFQRLPLQPEETEAILEQLQSWLEKVQAAVVQGGADWRVVEESPGEFLRRLHDWFQNFSNQPTIADTANV